MAPFREEFELLQDLCARQVRLRLAPAPGVAAAVLSDYGTVDPCTWRLPDLAYGSEAWAVVRLTVSGGAVAKMPNGGLVELSHVEAELVDTASAERRFLSGPIAVPVVSEAALRNLPEDERVASRIRELESAELQMRIRAAARRGDWALAERLMARAERDAARHPWLRDVMRTLREHLAGRDRERFAKEAAYASSRLRRRIAEKGTSMEDAFSSEAESQKRSYLRRRSRQGRQER